MKAQQYIRENFNIHPPKGGMIPFDLYEFQDATIERLQNNPKNIIKKGRQMGGTNMLIADMFLKILSHDSGYGGYSCMYVTSNSSQLRYVQDKIDIMAPHLITKRSRNEIETVSRGRIDLFSDRRLSFDTIRYDIGRYDYIVLDEFAYFSDDAKNTVMWNGADMSNITILSSKSSDDEIEAFNDLFEIATHPNNEWVATYLPWYVHPELTLEWRKMRIDTVGGNRFSMLYE